MNVGETNNELRRLFFTIYVSDGSALATTAAVSPPVGAVQVSLNGASFVNAGGTLVHIGDGSYFYEATAGEVAAAGFLAVKYQNTGFRTEIDWVEVGNLFLVGETTPSRLRLPLTIYDLGSPPVLATGATVTTASDLQISINGNAYANSSGSLHEVGSGLYYYQATTADASSLGAIVVKYSPSSSFSELITWHSIDIDASTIVPTPTLDSVTPAPGQLDADPNVARWTPVVMVFEVPANYHVTIQAQIGQDSALWMSAYDELISGSLGQDALAPLFSDKSTVSFTGSFESGRSVTASILPNGGWQRSDVMLVPCITIEVV